MRRLGIFLFSLFCFLSVPALAQRQRVLPQIHEPHAYYYRELYLPQLTSGPSSLSWSPNSQELVFSMGGTLWRQELDGESAHQLTDGPGYDYQPDWSPDGRSIVYVSYQKDAMELWLLDLASGKSHPLTTSGAVNVEPRWSPDGNRLLWVSTEYNGHFHVFAGEFADGQLKNVTRMTGETKSSLPRYYYSAFDMEINPAWSRDGKEILFVSNRGHIYGTGGFWVMKAEPGAEAREIHYEETSWKARPDFSPDGSRLVYSSYIGRQWHQLWVLPAKGGDAFPISYGNWDETCARWSPDSKRIAYITNREGNTAIEWQEMYSAERKTFHKKNRKYLRPYGVLRLSAANNGIASPRRRISITDASGRFYAPPGAWIQADDAYDRGNSAFEAHYFYSGEPAEAEFDLPVGTYSIEVVHGLEYTPFKTTVRVEPDKTSAVEIRMKPLDFNPDKGRGWIASDLHVHMNYGGTYRNTPVDMLHQAEAEGIRVVNQLTVNKEVRFPDIQFSEADPQVFGDLDAHILWGQEFHTSYWGHRGILGLQKHLLFPGYAGYPNTAAASLFPMNADVYDIAHNQGALVGAVHPFDEVPDPFAKPSERITDELPVDVALGKLDYIEVVGFSDHKSTAEVWYKLLNLGFRIPAGGGTDATTNYAAPIRGQIGFERVYVWLPGGPWDVPTWKAQLKQGRTFATNGPLIEFTMDGQSVGSELKFDSPPHSIPFTAKLRSIVPVDHLEVVCNGKVVQSLKLDSTRTAADATGSIPISVSGWCVLRASGDQPEPPILDHYPYATTSPVYITIAGKRPVSTEDARYFEAWVDQSIEVTNAYPDWNSPEEKARVLARLREGKAIFSGMR